MRQRPLFRHLAHKHRDRAPDCLIDVNDENLVAIPDENRAAAAGGEHSTNMYLNHRFVHCVDGTDGRTKNKPLPATRPSLAAGAEMVVSREESVTHGSPRIPICRTERPEICCWFFLNRPCMFRRINNCPLCSR